MIEFNLGIHTKLREHYLFLSIAKKEKKQKCFLILTFI